MSDKIINSKVSTDYENGEVKRREEQYSIKTYEPDYVKLYIKAWCEFKEIKSINMAFLCALLPYMSYAEDGQQIFFNAALKRKIGKDFGWSEKTVTKRVNVELDRLKKAGVIKRIETSTFQVNPELFGKGDWKDIRRLIVSFHLSTGKITHEHENEQIQNEPGTGKGQNQDEPMDLFELEGKPAK